MQNHKSRLYTGFLQPVSPSGFFRNKKHTKPIDIVGIKEYDNKHQRKGAGQDEKR